MITDAFSDYQPTFLVLVQRIWRIFVMAFGEEVWEKQINIKDLKKIKKNKKKIWQERKKREYEMRREKKRAGTADV